MPAAALRSLHDLIDSGDPFGGRRNPGVPSRLTIQAADGVPLYLAMTESDIAASARALASSWSLLGVHRGDYVLIYDYGTSPLTLFASWCFVPWLQRGAADLLGAVPICNDGLPEFASRALHVLRYLRPRVTVVDYAHMPLFLHRVSDEGASLADWTEVLVVSADEETVPPDQVAGWARVLGVPVRLLLRSGGALFFAAECEWGAIHADPRHYRVGVARELDGRIAATGEGSLWVTNRFLQGTSVDSYLANVYVAIGRERCRCGRSRPMRCLS